MTTVAEIGIEARYSSVDKANTSLDKLDKRADSAEKSVGRFSRTSTKMAGALGSVAGRIAAMGVAFVSVHTAMQSISQARGFSSAIAEVTTLLDNGAESTALLESETRRLAKAYGGDATSQAKAFYQAISAGADGAAGAVNILEAANKLAIGGITDVTTGVDVLTTVVGAYGKGVLSVNEISDTLFTGMKGGKTTIGELANSLGQVVPLSAQLGVSFKETVAAISAITLQGKTTSVAATQTKGLMEALIRSGDASSAAGKFAKSLGLDLSETAIKAKGLTGVIEDMVKVTGGSKAAILKLVGSSEALGAVMSLSGVGAENFNKILANTETQAGATQTAFELMSEGIDQRLNLQLAKMRDIMIAVGNALLSVLVPALEAIPSVINGLIVVMKSLSVVAVTLAVAAIPKLAVMLSTTLVAALAKASASVALIELQFIAGAIASNGLTGALRALSVGLALVGGPIGLLVALLAGGATYWMLFKKGADDAATELFNARNAAVEVNKALGVFHATAAPSAIAKAQSLADSYFKAASAALALAKAELIKQKTFNAMATGGHILTMEVQAGMSAKLHGLITDITVAEKDLAEAVELRSAAYSAAGGGAKPTQIEVPKIEMPKVEMPKIIGGGGGGAIADQFATRLESLITGLRTEKEALDAWRATSLTTLDEGRANGLLKDQEHNALRLQVEKQYQDELHKLKADGVSGALGQASDMFGDLNKMAGGGFKKLLKAQQVFSKASALMSTLTGAAQVLADPKLGFLRKLAAVASVVATGMGFVKSLGGGGSAPSAQPASTSAAGTQTAAPVTSDQHSAPQRVIVDFQGRELISVDMMAEIVEKLQGESRNGVILEFAT